MSQQLTDNISRMSNAELIGLAKNRFLPGSVQMAIAKTGYARARDYLAANEGLEKPVRDYMWSDECNKGYSLKTALVSGGHYSDSPDKLRELYERYPNAWNRSSWRLASAFFGSYWSSRSGASATPPDLLNRIYDDQYDPRSRNGRNKMGFRSYELNRLASHNNVDLELAIKLSQSGIKDIEKKGFDKIVELSR